MGQRSIVLKPNSLVKAGYYITAPVFIAVSIYLLYSFFSDGVGSRSPVILDLSLVIASFLTLISYAVSLPVFHRFQIEFQNDRVQQTALLNKSIPYSEIKTLIIGNGGIEIHGSGLWNRISIGDLYLNYENARDLLSEKVKDLDDIRFKGNVKYIQEFKTD
jgi:hypothetical protein